MVVTIVFKNPGKFYGTDSLDYGTLVFGVALGDVGYGVGVNFGRSHLCCHSLEGGVGGPGGIIVGVVVVGSLPGRVALF